MMLEELQRRNYAQSTVRGYLRIVQDFAQHFHQRPDQLGPDHLRQYQAHLFQDRKLNAGTVQQYVAALRFFFNKTLKRRYLLDDPQGTPKTGQSGTPQNRPVEIVI
jgi:integrase/recombinase XerD